MLARTTLITGLAIALAACGQVPMAVNYEGPRLPASEEVLLLGTPNFEFKTGTLNERLFIVCANGKSTEGPMMNATKWDYPFSAAVKPGLTSVGIMYSDQLARAAFSDLAFEAKPGKSYQMRHKLRDNGGVQFWITEAGSEEHVDEPAHLQKFTGDNRYRSCTDVTQRIRKTQVR